MQAGVLIGTKGDRLFGKVIAETATNVIFQSDIVGRLTVPQSKILDLERNPVADSPPPLTAGLTNASTNVFLWHPPGVGKDGADWVQLKSGEWLRGDIKYIQQKEVEFDSDEIDQQTLKLKDVSQVFTAHRIFTQLPAGSRFMERL